MKKKITKPFMLFSRLLRTLFFGLDLNSYQLQSRTIPCEKNGIIMSITSFNGDTESGPFIKSLGHAWVSIENRSGHHIYVKDNEVKNNEIITFSIWAISGHRGVVYNLESNFILNYDRYVGRQSLSVNIDELQLKKVEDFIDLNDDWNFGMNCSCWSLQLWNEVVSEIYKLKTQTLVYTPKRLQRSLSEFDCVEVDKDFSRSHEIFFYHDGIKMELKLCS